MSVGSMSVDGTCRGGVENLDEDADAFLVTMRVTTTCRASDAIDACVAKLALIQQQLGGYTSLL